MAILPALVPLLGALIAALALVVGYRMQRERELRLALMNLRREEYYQLIDQIAFLQYHNAATLDPAEALDKACKLDVAIRRVSLLASDDVVLAMMGFRRSVVEGAKDDSLETDLYCKMRIDCTDRPTRIRPADLVLKRRSQVAEAGGLGLDAVKTVLEALLRESNRDHAPREANPDGEPQGGGYSPPAARSSKPTP